MRFELKDELVIDGLYSFHYFELAKDFVFAGEKHDFWEFVYVDKGELEVSADFRGFRLRQGDIIFHKPNEFHSIWANRVIAPNAVVVTFSCRSEAMKRFEGKLFRLGDAERNLLSQLVKEALQTFEPPLDDPYHNILKRKPDAPFASEQLIKLYLQLFLLRLLRDNERQERNVRDKRLSSIAAERTETELVNRIVLFLESNAEQPLTLQDVAETFHLSKNHLNKLFTLRMGTGIMHRFRLLRIERAKRLIRESGGTVAEIAERLQYSSPGNFTRHFKQVTGMSPSDYARSIQSRAMLD